MCPCSPQCPQIFLSFVVLVVIASYTANTAAFLTIGAKAERTPHSVADLLAWKQKLV